MFSGWKISERITKSPKTWKTAINLHWKSMCFEYIRFPSKLILLKIKANLSSLVGKRLLFRFYFVKPPGVF